MNLVEQINRLLGTHAQEITTCRSSCQSNDFKRLHLDSSSFHVDGDYINKATQEEAKPGRIEITYGYSRDHRPDLKQFIIDLMCSGDGDIPLVF